VKDRLLKSRLREVFIVTMDDGSAWRGLLYAVDDRTVALREAERLTPDAPGTPVDGELLLPRDQLAYLQRP
jgi:hypothetical protein